MATRTHTDFNVVAQKMVWDPKTIEIRTRSVEKTLEPLVYQVTSLVNQTKKSHKKGKSKKAPQLAKEIDLATIRLVEAGENIANDFPEIREPMLEACKEATIAGESMRNTARDFAEDPCSSQKRSTMIRAARGLLAAVTRLLCIADMADVYRLVATLKMVEDRLKEMRTAENQTDLLNSFKEYGDELMRLAKLTGIRQADLKDPRRKDEMAAARATLKKSSRMLLTTSKAYVNHPEVLSAKDNRDYVMEQVCEAVGTISDVAQSSGKSAVHPYEEPGKLATALDDMVTQVNADPNEFHEKQLKEELKYLMDQIQRGSSEIADGPCTRDVTRDKIYAASDTVKNTLVKLLDEYTKHFRGVQPCEVQDSQTGLTQNAKKLGKQLRKAVVDHISDSFLETNVPLMLLIEAAQAGNEAEVEDCAIIFSEHASKLQEVAEMACNMSINVDGIKMVRIASSQLQALCPQVVNAARTLAVRPKSHVAQENMGVFREAWLGQVRVLTEAVDDITTIDDFLAVSESHILDDVNRCVEAMQMNDPESLDRSAGAVRGRVMRVCHVVNTEMDNYETGQYTDTVNRSVLVVKDNIMPQFAEYVDMVVDALSMDPMGEVDENSFIEAARLVYEGIRDIRRAVMMKNPLEETDSDDEEVDQEDTLLSKMAEAQARQREKLAYEQLKAGGKVQFEVHSEAADDPDCSIQSSIMVNGIEYCPMKRGHNVVVLDQIGSVVSAHAFDTTEPAEGTRMSKFLDDIPADHVVLIAVQDTTGKGVEMAADSLKNLGAVEPFNPGYRNAWAFAGYKGNYTSKLWVSQVSRPRFEGPCNLSDMINTPAADMGKIKIEIHSEAIEDGDYTRAGSIKINSVERSPMGRGMNVVILDNAGNYLTSKTFDTADPQYGRSEGQRMTKYLDELPSERIVMVGGLENVGQGMDEVKEALLRIGAEDPVDPGHNGSYALLGYTGPQKVVWLKQVACQRRTGPAKIVEFICTPAAEEKMNKEPVEEVYSKYEEPEEEAVNVEEFENFEREELGAQSDYEGEGFQTLSKRSARSLMRALPAEEKAKIAKLAEGLQMEKNRLVTEVSKWDDQGNDIIVLAKKMCMIMMDMSDFTRGTGPLKTTMDVIQAAERIAKYGAQMNKLAGDIAEKCPTSHTRSDLLAYLQRIALYSHQLTITARVKADVQMISGELIVSGLDSATSLIQSAKNLMNAVILTVKASYIASTKHKHATGEGVSWRMKAPAKKPLFKVEATEAKYTVRSTDVTDTATPLSVLSDFH